MRYPLNKENVQSTAPPAHMRGGLQLTQELTESGWAAGMKRRKPTDREEARKRHGGQDRKMGGQGHRMHAAKTIKMAVLIQQLAAGLTAAVVVMALVLVIVK